MAHFGLSKRAHITPVFVSLHWQPATGYIKFKTMTHRTVTGSAFLPPLYKTALYPSKMTFQNHAPQSISGLNIQIKYALIGFDFMCNVVFFFSVWTDKLPISFTPVALTPG